MDVVLSESVLDVVGLLIVFPVFVQLVDFAGDIALLFRVESLGRRNQLIEPCAHIIINLKYQINIYLRHKIFENLAINYFTFTALYSADKHSYEQQIFGHLIKNLNYLMNL